MERNYVSQAKPSQAKPSQAKPSQAKPSNNACIASYSSSRGYASAWRSTSAFTLIEFSLRHSAHASAWSRISFDARSCSLRSRMTHHSSREAVAHKKAGFTLIELSIVLVIIGLLVGGVLVGQDLIKAAELRSVMTDIEKYKTTTMTFRAKYDCLPGDCPDATKFFGDYNGAGTCAPGDASTPSTATNQTTCNGNGDGMIWYAVPGNTFYYSWETNRFWQHLSAAGLVAEQYAGIGNMDGGQASLVWASRKIGFNIPASKWPKAGYSLLHSSMFPLVGGQIFPNLDNNKNKFVIGAETRCLGHTSCAWDLYAGIHHQGPVFTPQEAFQIDSKIDDGKPGTGSVMAHPFSNNGYSLYCSNGDSDTAEYFMGDYDSTITATTKRCPLFIDAGF